MADADIIVVGSGSAGSVVAAELARRGAGRVLVLEAGPGDHHPLVAMPFGLVWLIGSKGRDWRYRSAPLDACGGRTVAVPRGRMVGGSGSLNSMVWFRGRASDFDGWGVPGWGWVDVEPAFEAVEAKLKPRPMEGVHPLTAALATMLPGAGEAPSPDRESAGVFSHNMDRGRRMSASRAFLHPSGAAVRTVAEVDRLIWQGDRAAGVRLVDGGEVRASKGVVLASGSIGSPAILMRSGIGPGDDLRRIGIDVRRADEGVGANLHDHPGFGLHFEGPGTGYGLEPAQWPAWATAAVEYALFRTGRFASPTVEGGAFFNARGEGAEPDVQTHFIPFYLSHHGRRYAPRSGYFADVCLCRPTSRGRLSLASKNPHAAPVIDLGLFREPSDLDTLTAGVERLRGLLARAGFGRRRGREVGPAARKAGDALRETIRLGAGTAYHPVGTLALGGPVSARCAVMGADGLWVADASVMPKVTSANTNAPSMMIGYRAAEMIAEDLGT